jgi:hypothetical protein
MLLTSGHLRAKPIVSLLTRPTEVDTQAGLKESPGIAVVKGRVQISFQDQRGCYA